MKIGGSPKNPIEQNTATRSARRLTRRPGSRPFYISKSAVLLNICRIDVTQSLRLRLEQAFDGRDSVGCAAFVGIIHLWTKSP